MSLGMDCPLCMLNETSHLASCPDSRCISGPSFLLGRGLGTMYVVALVMRETLGEELGAGNGAESFDSIPKSFLNTFRCLVAGDCADETGRPIFVLVPGVECCARVARVNHISASPNNSQQIGFWLIYLRMSPRGVLVSALIQSCRTGW